MKPQSSASEPMVQQGTDLANKSELFDIREFGKRSILVSLIGHIWGDSNQLSKFD